MINRRGFMKPGYQLAYPIAMGSMPRVGPLEAEGYQILTSKTGRTSVPVPTPLPKGAIHLQHP